MKKTIIRVRGVVSIFPLKKGLENRLDIKTILKRYSRLFSHPKTWEYMMKNDRLRFNEKIVYELNHNIPAIHEIFSLAYDAISRNHYLSR